jgi:DNA-directed RNA polymerase specialized sigma24 family protein
MYWKEIDCLSPAAALQLVALVTLQCSEKGALPMADDGSISRWLGPLQAGDPAAAQQLWERYFRRLVGLARLKLRNAPRGATEDEDVALSAFASFCRRAEQGRFPQLSDRDSLWRLLVVLTVRKAQHLVRDETRQKRGGGDRPVSDCSGGPDEESVLEQVLSREPTPDMAAQLAEEYRGLLSRLADRELEAIALLRMEGYTVEEIAQELGYVARSIKRKLHLIRNIWEKEGGS